MKKYRPKFQKQQVGRKSTAIIALALVPLGLLGLGYVACDRNPDAEDQAEMAGAFGDEDPRIVPMLGDDGTTMLGPDGQLYSADATYAGATPSFSWRTSPFFGMPIPVPVWVAPAYSANYHSSHSSYGTPSANRANSYSSRHSIFGWSSFSSGSRSSSSFSRSSSSSGSHVSSSGTSRGGFGSSSHSFSSSSS